MEYWLVFGSIIAALLVVAWRMYLAGPPPEPRRVQGCIRFPDYLDPADEVIKAEAEEVECIIHELREEAYRLGLLPSDDSPTHQRRMLYFRWRGWFRERKRVLKQENAEWATFTGWVLLYLALLPLLVPLAIGVLVYFVITAIICMVKGRPYSIGEEEDTAGRIQTCLRDEENAAIEASVLAEFEELERRFFGEMPAAVAPVETQPEQEENGQAAT